MADDWESAADEEEVAVPVNRWEGEDEDEPIAEAWDADPDEAAAKRKAEAAAAANKPPPAPVVSARKKKLAAEEEKKRLEKEAEEAENDPAIKAQRKAEQVERARKRDASLAASLLGVELAEGDYVPPAGDRDDGSDIAGGGEKMSEAEKREVKAGGQSLEEFNWELDADVDKLAALICKRAVEMPPNAKNSARLLRFLKSVSNGLCDPMKLDDVAELRRAITAKHSEMTAKQKTAEKGKKKGGAAPAGTKKANTVKVASASGGGRNTYGDELDEYAGGDDDFM